MESHVDVKDAGPCRKVVRIEADWSAVEPEYAGVVKVFTSRGEVPGFRRGRAPKELIEKRYAKAIADETRDVIVPKLYREAMSREKLRTVAVVNVKDPQVVRGHGVTLEVTVDVAPDFALPSYKGIPVKGEATAVGVEDVDKAYQRLIDGYSRYQDVAGRPVRRGDMAMLDYSGQCEGKPVAELGPECAGVGEGSNFWALVGEPEYLPGLAEGMIGMSVGETRPLLSNFPPDYPVKAMGGKSVEYTLKLVALREKLPPEVNAEFLKPFGIDSVETLRERIREDLVSAGEERERDRRRAAIAHYLLANTEVPVPQSIVEQETNQAVRNMVRRITQQGATRQQLTEHRDTILETASKSSTERVKLGYVLARIAENESIDVSEKEVNEQVAAMAVRSQMGVTEFRAHLEKNNAMEGVKSEMRAERTMGWLLEQAKITD
jgi:trigger factor